MTRSWTPASPTSRSRSVRRLPFLVLLLATGAPARAEVRFEVGGRVRPSDEGVVVDVEIRNRGDQAVSTLDVVGELFGREDVARLPKGLAAGASDTVVLRFPDDPPRPGVHALPLRLEFPEGGTNDASGALATSSRRAFLLLALGASPPPAIRLAAEDLELDAIGSMRVVVSSLDGAPHRVRLAAFTPRGLLPDGAPVDIDVRADGPTTASLPLRRASSPRGSRHGVLVVGETRDGALANAAVASATVVVAPDPGLLPKLRWPLLALALLLIGAALAREFGRPREPEDASGRADAPTDRG